MDSFAIWLEAAYRNKKGCPYWGDGGSGVIPFANSTGKFLVSHRGEGVNEGGTYGVFGGGIFLDETPYQTIEELAHTDYPKKHALEELAEETGYRGPMSLTEIYVFKDNKVNRQGEPCNFYYWNYVGICPQEFPVNPGDVHAWEEGGQSGWRTFQELMALSPLHFGLKAVLQNAGPKLAGLARKFSK